MEKDKLNFSTKMGQYTIVQTDDGSITIRSSLFDEDSHSSSGAWSETLHNYVNATQVIKTLSKLNKLSILEIGFANGVGPHATFKSIDESSLLNESTGKIKFISTEIDPEFAGWTLENSELSKYLKENNFTIKTSETKILCQNDRYELHIYLGDVRETIYQIKNDFLDGFDCIYHDPYSPKKNPTLWTIEWLREIKSLMKENAILSTYCASVRFRKGLLLNDLFICSLKGFGRKRSITIASKNKSLGDEKLMQELSHSKAQPFMDSET